MYTRPVHHLNGKRYNRETLEIRYRGKNISEVLEMTFQQAYNFLKVIRVYRKYKNNK